MASTDRTGAPMQGDAELLWAAGALLGEGATWDAQGQRLWWVDVRGRRLHRMDEAGGDRRSWDLPDLIGCLALTAAPGVVLVGLRGGVHRFDTNRPDAGGETLEFLGAPPELRAAHRINDGKVDPSGGFWFGTMEDAEQKPEGALYRLEAGGQPRRLAGPYTVPNGPAFAPDGSVLYLADSPAGLVHAFDVRGPALGPAREFLRFDEGEGHPDGITVDAEGCLWVAHWDGGRVSRVAPDGSRLGSIALPVPKVTSCAFGGADLRSLYVTTAGGDGQPGQGAAGGLFRLRPGVAGIAAARVA